MQYGITFLFLNLKKIPNFEQLLYLKIAPSRPRPVAVPRYRGPEVTEVSGPQGGKDLNTEHVSLGGR